MDLLTSAIKQYSSILDKKITLTLGKGKNKFFVDLIFTKNEFFHMAGFHKLSGIHQLRTTHKSRKFNESVFDKVLSGEINQSLLEDSDSYAIIKDRLEIISSLSSILENKSLVIKKIHYDRSGSRIPWDYLMHFPFNGSTGYIFFSSNKKENSSKDRALLSCISTFTDNSGKYGLDQKKFTVLKVEVDGKVIYNNL